MEPYKKKSRPAHKKIALGGKVAIKDEKKTIALNSRALYQHFLDTYAKSGDDVSMILVLKRPKRSESQNNFYHLYLSLIALSSGHTMRELKDWVNEKILGKGISEVYGDEVRNVGHSSDLNISEFVEMMNRIQERTEIPMPDPKPFNLPLSWDEYGKLREEQTETYKKMKPKIKKRK